MNGKLTAYFNHPISVNMPDQAILDCSAQGDCSESVEYWLPKVVIVGSEEQIRAELKEYGAWDAEELADNEQNKRRLLWIAAGNLREEMRQLPSLDKQLDEMLPQWEELVKALIPQIADDYRASNDPEDTEPGMCLTVGFTPATIEKEASWSYQTGDNSYTGGAYGHPHWGVVSLYRDSDPAEVAADIADQIGELASQ